MSRQTRANPDPLDPSNHAVPGLTPDQNHQLFEIYRRKAEQEEQEAIARAKQTKELAEKTAELVEKKAQLEMDLMRRESEARITATAAAVVASNPATNKIRSMNEEDDLIGEIPSEVQALNVRYAGLPQDEIVKIFVNKFKPINLYRLRHMRGLQYDKLNDMDRIGIEDGMLKLRKTSGTYKDFGKSFHEVWSESFLNYTSIMVSLFGKTAPDLHAALSAFHNDIYQLSRVYEWQDALLPMTIEVHTYITTTHPSDPAKWVIRPEFQGRFCNPGTILGHSSKRKRSTSPSRVSGKATRGKNDSSVTCENFNKGSCTWPQCQRAHKCKGCGATNHGQTACPRKG
jgi:hypothetical protein